MNKKVKIYVGVLIIIVLIAVVGLSTTYKSNVTGAISWPSFLRSWFGRSIQTAPTTLSLNCGNGWIEAGEQCDDGNSNDFDGCNENCQMDKCTESDGGNKPFTHGTLTITSSGKTNSWIDSCDSTGIVLTEYSCNGPHYLQNTYDCSTLEPNSTVTGSGFTDVCSDGACI